jgi:hypothetical protein
VKGSATVIVVITALLLSMPDPPQVAPERGPKVVVVVAMATSPLESREAIIKYFFIRTGSNGGLVIRWRSFSTGHAVNVFILLFGFFILNTLIINMLKGLANLL